MVLSTLDICWQQLLWDCSHHGKTVKKDDSTIKELMGNYIFLERPQDLKIPFRKKIDSYKVFLEGVQKGFYDVQGYPIKGQALYDYVKSWEDTNQIYIQQKQRQELGFKTKGFVYTYPERLLNILTNTNIENEQETEFINQFTTINNRLTQNQGSNRAVATLYHPGIDKNKTDIPCLNWLQATIREDNLELHCMFRSNDLYGAWPSNMYFLTALGLQIANFHNKPFNGIHYHSSSLHIYETDLPAVKQILGE